jgi:hypothetical protein
MPVSTLFSIIACCFSTELEKAVRKIVGHAPPRAVTEPFAEGTHSGFETVMLGSAGPSRHEDLQARKSEPNKPSLPRHVSALSMQNAPGRGRTVGNALPFDPPSALILSIPGSFLAVALKKPCTEQDKQENDRQPGYGYGSVHALLSFAASSGHLQCPVDFVRIPYALIP